MENIAATKGVSPIIKRNGKDEGTSNPSVGNSVIRKGGMKQS